MPSPPPPPPFTSLALPYFKIAFFFFPAHLVLPRVSVVGPLKVEKFSQELAGHSDQKQVSYVLQGLQHGFRLGFHSAHKLKPAKRNKPSALHHAHIVDAYLANEVSLGRVAGPISFPPPPFPRLYISSFGVIPKKGQPDKWRLIVDLSSPGVLV